ncbi:MAG: transcription termination factor NusA [Gemmatimonadales bacterium]|nr:transcription termination factor NusA [Gemmatimonadales bacterium]MDZ4390068.1 transcription termination factor NusA [Gemmatimonadales bacterium]
MATSPDMIEAFRELANAKQLDRAELLDLLRDGIHAALMRKYGPNVRFELSVDELTGTLSVMRLRQVVEKVEDDSAEVSLEEARFEDPDFQPGDMLEEEIPFEAFGRLAVQAAKQRIIQRVREGERNRIREEFSHKVGELLSGEIQQIERGKFVLLLNRFREAEAIIPYRDQNHREHFNQGETIRAVLKRIEETPKGPRLVLSRSDPLFVKALFKLEVPEIQQGVVEIRALAREAGSRTKVAVISRDDAIDPVGACVGLKGSRVQSIVNELAGERIDIVPWSPDPERFARLALAPARVAKVFSEVATRTINAVVDEDQLSLAIGRNGQNVRLASELTGWKIDLYSSREWLERGGEGTLFGGGTPGDDEDDTPRVPLAQLEGLSPELVAVLAKADYTALNDVLDLELEEIAAIPGMTSGAAEELVRFLGELTEEEEPTADEPAAADEAPSGDEPSAA